MSHELVARVGEGFRLQIEPERMCIRLTHTHRGVIVVACRVADGVT
jgi:hypothetical protein